MKKIDLNIKNFLILILLGLGSFLYAQEQPLVLAESKVTVFGTSNIHDWDVVAKSMSGKASFEVAGNQLKDIKTLSISVESESLKSGKSGMDKNTYKALKTDKFKTITYKIFNVTKVTLLEDGSYKVETQGDLTIIGVTKRISVPVIVKMNGKKAVVSGKFSIDMTHYTVVPPTALMGTIKTGKELTIDFKITYN